MAVKNRPILTGASTQAPKVYKRSGDKPDILVGRSLPNCEEEDVFVMSKFLNLLDKDLSDNPSKLIPYTEELDAELDELLAGVEID